MTNSKTIQVFIFNQQLKYQILHLIKALSNILNNLPPLNEYPQTLSAYSPNLLSFCFQFLLIIFTKPYYLHNFIYKYMIIAIPQLCYPYQSILQMIYANYLKQFKPAQKYNVYSRPTYIIHHYRIMFGVLAQKIINGFLGEYVEGFNSQNLNIGLWRGEVVIQNVKLRGDVIQKFNVPFNVKYSRLGSLKMNIPWSSLSTSKIEVELSGLEMIITQLPQQKWQCKNHKIIEQRKKQIQSFCDSVFEEFAKNASQSSKQMEEKKEGYLGNMLVKIIDNMQITIKNIHIRFQDEIGGKFSCGVTLDQLKINTVNKAGQQQFIDRTKKQYQNEPLRKKLVLSNLGIYWNEKSQFFRGPDPHQQMIQAISSQNEKQKKMSYLILMSFNAMLYLKQPGKQFVEPQMNLLIDFDELKVKISNEQLQQIVNLGERLQKYRNQVKAQNRKRLTQLEMIANREVFVQLFPKYFQKKCSAKEISMIEDILQKMQTTNFEAGIKAYLQQKQKQKMIQQKIKKSQGWFSGPKELTQEQKAEIQKYIIQNFGKSFKAVKRPQNFYYLRVNFNLKALQLAITNQADNKLEQGIRFRLCDIKTEFNLRQDGYMLNFAMNDIRCDIFKKTAKMQQIINVVQKMQIDQVSQNKQYVRLQIFGNPLHKKHLNQEIIVRTQELMIQFHPDLIKIAKQFADIKINPQSEEAALEALGQIKNKASNAANQFKKPFEKKSFLQIDVKVSAITLLLFFDPAKTSEDVWVVKIGQIQIYSDPQTLKKIQFNYDEPMQRYGLTFSKLSFTHFGNKNIYFDARSKNYQINRNEKILEDLGIDICLELFQNTLDAIPKIKVTAVLHNTEIFFNEFTYESLQKIDKCFSVPQKKEVVQSHEKGKMQSKAAIMKNAKKIGIVYEQSKSPQKYIGVLAGPYLYLYSDKRDVEYTAYYYLKNCEITYNSETSSDKKVFEVVFHNSVNNLVLGFEKSQPMQQWVKAIKNIDEIEKQYKGVIEQKQKIKKSPSIKKYNPNKLNFQIRATIEQVKINTILKDKKSIQILMKSLDTRTKIYEEKNTVDISIHSIQLADNIYIYKYKELNNLLYSSAIQGKQKLIQINLVNNSVNHPDFNNISVLINVQFGKLICNYKPETVERLMNFYLPKDDQFAARRKAKGQQLTKQQKQQIQIERKQRKRELIQNQLKRNAPQLTKIQIKLKIEQISVSLVNRYNKVMFARLGLTGFNYKLGISSRRIIMSGSLEEMWFGDYSCYPDTIYEEKQKYTHVDYIIESYNNSRDMLNFGVELIEIPDKNGKNLFVNTSLYDIKASYIQQPVLRVITYLLEQVLPSLTPPEDLTQIKQLPQNDIKPTESTMILIANAENVLAVVQPRSRQDEYLQLNVSKINVTNTSLSKDYIKSKKQNESQKVLIEQYNIKLSEIKIMQKFRGQQVKLTNDLNINVSVDLIQNSPYYRKMYRQRFDGGMRIQCQLSPFVMCINHDDYNFIMKCLYWNITYDDNAEGYMFAPPIVRQTVNTQPPSQPLHFGLTMEKIILGVTENNFPLSVLQLNQMRYDLTLDQSGMYMIFKMKHLSGSTIQKTIDQKISLQRGMFNSFGYEKKHSTQKLYNMNNFISIFERTEQINNTNQNTVHFSMNTIKSTQESNIRIKVRDIGIAIEIKRLVTLSKLALLEQYIQPPPSEIVPIRNAGKKQSSSDRKCMTINIDVENFLGCLGDKNFENYIVMQGVFLVKLKFWESKTQQELAQLSKTQKLNGRFRQLSNYQIEAKKYSLYFCNVNDIKNKRFLLRPVNIYFLLRQFYGKINEMIFLETEMDGMVDKIVVQCSVTDLLLVNKIIQDNLESFAQANNKAMSSSIKQEIVVNQSKLSVKSEKKKQQLPSQSMFVLSRQHSSMSIVNQSVYIDKESIKRNIKQSTKKISQKSKGTLKLQPIQIRLINNYGLSSIPVLRILTEQTCLMFGGNTYRNYFIISPVIKFDFFNPRSASWQPVIQTFQIQFNLNKQTTQYGSKMELTLTSSEAEYLKQIKLNVSSQFISSLLTTLEILKKQKKSLLELNKVPEIGQISPYIAQNKTNSIITICREVQGKKADLDIKPQQKIKLKIGDSGSGQLLKFMYKNRVYETSLQKFGYVSIPKLKDLHLQFRIDKLNRIICFVEKISIKNATSSKLYCIRYNDKRQKIQNCIEMQSQMAIPVREEWFVQFSFNMKTFTPPTKVSSLTKLYQIKAQSQKFKLSIAERQSILNHSVISVRAPFVVSNCLPKGIKLQFISNSKHKSTTQIAAQSHHQVFANENISNIQFKILIEGFYWSRQFCIDFEKLEKKQKEKEHYFAGEIQLADREKGITTIQYKFQIDQQRCQYKLYFSCPAFILSELEEDIHVYGNPKADEIEKKIERYYQLGGQTQFWKSEPEENKKQNQNRRIDKVILVGTEVGSKLRICGTNDCIIDFSQPFEISSLGVHQARVVVQRQIGVKKISVFTMLGIQIELKKMTMKSNILSKQITIRYRYIISNVTGIPLFIKQEGSQKLCFHVEPGQKKPFYYTVPAIGLQTRNMIVKSTDTYESLPIASNTLGMIYFRLKLQKKSGSNIKSSILSSNSRIQGKSQAQYAYFKLNTHEINSYIFYEFSSVKYEDLPYQIQVRSQKFKVFVPDYQKVLVKNSEPFLFINQIPQNTFKILLLVHLLDSEQTQEVTLQVDNLNFEQTYQFSTPFISKQVICYIHTVFDDSKKIIVIEQANQQSIVPEQGLQKIKIKIQKLSLSLIHNHSETQRPYQSFYFYLANLELILLKTNLTSNFQIKLQFLQFDQEQPFNNSDPVILTPQKYKRHTSLLPKDKPLSIFNLVIEVDNRFTRNMFIKRIQVEINNIVVRATTYLIKLIMAMMKEYTEIFKTEAEFYIKKHVNTWKLIDIPEEGSRTFIQNIKIAPFTVLITAFIRVNQQDIQSAFLRTFLNALGVVMTDIDNAPIILYGIQLENCIDTFQGIQHKLIEHYKSSVIKQLYKILGSLSIIGNPVSLFRNISTGIKDLKEKPAEGFVSGPLEFGIGLADGTSSLIAHSMGGAFNSVSKATSSLAKAFALLSFDKQFEQTRLKQQMNKPRHVLEGLEKGGKAVLYGFKEGITGVVTQPIEQTKKGGPLGLVKGVGKGLAGLIVKPVTGIVDFAAQTTLGLKNTALYLEDKPNQSRIRYPRVFYTQNFSVRQYDQVDSKIMSVINRTKYQQKYGFENPIFIYAFAINQIQFLVVLKQDVAFVRIDTDKVEWAIPITSMITTKQQDKLRITSDKRREWYTKKINVLVEFSQTRDADSFIKIVEELKVNMRDRTINQSYYM